jgi:hypothetical protein
MKKGPKSSILRKIALNLPKHLSRFLDLRAPSLTGFSTSKAKSARKPLLIPKGR